MAKTVKDDLGKRASSAAEEAAERMRKRLEEGGGANEMVEREPADEEGRSTITIDDDDDDEPASTGTTNAEPDNRAARRRQRSEDLVRESREEAATARREAQEARERMARIEGQLAAQQQQRQQTQDDPHSAELKRLQERKNSIYLRYEAGKKAGTLTQAEVDKLEAEALEIEEKRIEVVAERKFGPRQAAPTAQELIGQMRAQEIAQRHSDVVSDGARVRWIQARMAQIVIEGGVDDPPTVDRVMAEARVKFHLPVPERLKPAASAAQQHRLAGPPRGGGGERSDGPSKVVMTSRWKDLADASFAHIKDDAKRWKAWAQSTTGQKIIRGEKYSR